MALTTYDLTLTLHDQSGAPMEGVEVVAALVLAETEIPTADYTTGGAFIPSKAVSTTGADGVAVLSLVPNADSTKTTAYLITAQEADTASQLMREVVTMPTADALLEDLT